jgi:hypothetical protein
MTHLHPLYKAQIVVKGVVIVYIWHDVTVWVVHKLEDKLPILDGR